MNKWNNETEIFKASSTHTEYMKKAESKTSDEAKVKIKEENKNTII